jgi:hypothetical protein
MVFSSREYKTSRQSLPCNGGSYSFGDPVRLDCRYEPRWDGFAVSFFEKIQRSHFHQKRGSRVTPEHVSFKTPTKPLFVYATGVPLLFPRVHTGWIDRKIPRNDVKWIGSLLLSLGQIRNAFRAAGYSAQEVEGFAEVLEERIAALNDL